jgi:hypothetical protein
MAKSKAVKVRPKKVKVTVELINQNILEGHELLMVELKKIEAQLEKLGAKIEEEEE